MGIGACDLFDQGGRVFYPDSIVAEGAYTDGTEFRVSHHHRVFCAPFPVGKIACAGKVYFRFKGAVESVLPSFYCGQDGDVLGFQGIGARLKYIGDLSFADKNSDLGFPDNQFRSVFYLILITWKTIEHGVI